MSKYRYRIIKKKDEDHFIVQRTRKNYLSLIKWDFVGMSHFTDECETIIKNAIEQEDAPNYIVVKEYD